MYIFFVVCLYRIRRQLGRRRQRGVAPSGAAAHIAARRQVLMCRGASVGGSGRVDVSRCVIGRVDTHRDVLMCVGACLVLVRVGSCRLGFRSGRGQVPAKKTTAKHYNFLLYISHYKPTCLVTANDTILQFICLIVQVHF